MRLLSKNEASMSVELMTLRRMLTMVDVDTSRVGSDSHRMSSEATRTHILCSVCYVE